MLALQFATATANLASQNAFLFLATHGPIFIASSSSATLIQCGFQYRRWNCSPIPPLVVKTIGTKSIPRCSHRNLYFLVFVSSAALVTVTVPAFGLRKDSPHACTGTRVADCRWVHYAHINGQSLRPVEAPPDLSVCVLALAVRRMTHKVAVN